MENRLYFTKITAINRSWNLACFYLKKGTKILVICKKYVRMMILNLVLFLYFPSKINVIIFIKKISDSLFKKFLPNRKRNSSKYYWFALITLHLKSSGKTMWLEKSFCEFCRIFFAIFLQCVLFGTFMIWFASITINLGPTFLSGALAANTESGHNAPSCPLVHGPFRHYILNVLWIVINIICVALTLFHLRKLHRDLTKANVEAVSDNMYIQNLSNVYLINFKMQFYLCK